MFELAPDQARTLVAIAAEGSFDAAAQRLHVTPSAISQRVRSLEVALGRPVLRRVRPVELTDSGRVLLRHARQLELLAADLAAELSLEESAGSVTVVVNGDSLSTWALPVLTRAADGVRLRVLREDQDHSLHLLRDGVATGAVTATGTPVPGCSSRRLGVMRYRPVCAPAFAARWFAHGVDAATLGRAPVVIYDDKDDLQDRFLLRYPAAEDEGRLDPPRHHIPATHEFGEAVRLGLGWGMLPELQIGDGLVNGTFVPVKAAAIIDVPLYWQQWRRSSGVLTRVADALVAAATAALR